jgi:hypothetical protein
MAKTNRPKDTNQLAKLIADIATSEQENAQPTELAKNPAAVALGRLGELKESKGEQLYT